jgi:hypothetical protein
VGVQTLARYRFQRTSAEGGGGAGGQQGQQQGGTGSGTGGAGQQGGGADGGGQQQSLLEADADDLNGGDDGGQQQQQNGAQGQQQVDLNALVGQLEDRLGQRFDAIADRRVNAILGEMRRNQGQQQQGGGNDQGGQQQGQQQSGSQPRTSQADLRAARLAFREYVGDEVRFISAEERAFAMDLGSALLVQQAQNGIDDEDRAGRTVAAEVAKKVKDLRKHYEDRTVAALRRRGALNENGGGGQQSRQQSGGNGVGDQSAWQKGAEIAARVRPRPPAE